MDRQIRSEEGRMVTHLNKQSIHAVQFFLNSILHSFLLLLLQLIGRIGTVCNPDNQFGEDIILYYPSTREGQMG